MSNPSFGRGTWQISFAPSILPLRNTHTFLSSLQATSNVDLETDRAIQKTLREAFPGCTVFTIAHRVNTIMDSDKILVMSDGHVAEFDSPQNLLAKEDSLFASIVHHAEAGDD